MIRFLLLAMVACLDVRVRAEGILAEARKTFSANGVAVIMAPGSLIERREGEVHLVKGNFFVELRASAEVHSAFGSLRCAADLCQALIDRTEEDLRARAVKGFWVVRRLGEKKDYGLSAGTQVTLMPVTLAGFAEMEFPQSLPWETTAKDWGKFYPGTAKDFRSTLIQFRQDWEEAVETASQLHQEFAKREIASYERALAAELARRKALEREDEKLRRLFHDKNDPN